MKTTYSWSINLHDKDGDIYESCILVHIGDELIVKFKDLDHLETFANSILKSLPEVRENLAQ